MELAPSKNSKAKFLAKRTGVWVVAVSVTRHQGYGQGRAAAGGGRHSGQRIAQGRPGLESEKQRNESENLPKVPVHPPGLPARFARAGIVLRSHVRWAVAPQAPLAQLAKRALPSL